MMAGMIARRQVSVNEGPLWVKRRAQTGFQCHYFVVFLDDTFTAC